LVLVSNTIEEWLKVQRQWMYLEPIFSSEDIKTQLPIESKRFDNVDKAYRKALSSAFSAPQIINFCSNKSF
jgi:dynein heavy chain